MQAPTDQPITKGQHGTSKAVDHRAWPDDIVYAPEDASFDSYQQRGSGVNDAGNALRIRGTSGLHQFAHLSESFIKAGDKVKRGQPIARMGYTGYVKPPGEAGKHLHYWIQRPDGSYVYPPTLYKDKFSKVPVTGGSEVANEAQVKNLYRLGLFREADASGLKTYVGKDANYIVSEMLGSKERKNLEADINNLRTQFPKVQAQVATLNAQLQTLTKQLADNDKAHKETVDTLNSDLTKSAGQIIELDKVIRIKDAEIKRLEALAGEEVTVGRAISVLVEAIKNLVRR